MRISKMQYMVVEEFFKDSPTSTNGSSMPQRQILGAVGGGFEACRSEPKFPMADFFFITCQTSEPFVAQAPRN